MEKEYLHEIKAIWDKIGEIERKLSAFYDDRHAENADRIDASEEGLCDIDEAYDQRVADVEEALCEISEMMEG